MSEQLRTDEELARRLAASEELEVGDGRQEQIEADELLARALSDEQDEPVQSMQGFSRVDRNEAERAAQALAILAPLRQRGLQGLATVCDDLESLVRQANVNDTDVGMSPGNSEPSVSLAASSSSASPGATGEAAAAAAAAPAAPAVPTLPGVAAVPSESAGSAAAAAPVSEVASAAAARHAEAPERNQTQSSLMADRLSEYMARAEARRADARRRREERLRALNAALDAHMQAGLAGTEVPPAEAVEAMINNHTVTSTWSTGPAGAQCVICVEDLTEGESVRTLPCGHVYHQECIDLWLQRSRLCPLCKRPIDSS